MNQVKAKGMDSAKVRYLSIFLDPKHDHVSGGSEMSSSYESARGEYL